LFGEVETEIFRKILEYFLGCGRLFVGGYGGTKREKMTKIGEIVFDRDSREPGLKKKSREERLEF